MTDDLPSEANWRVVWERVVKAAQDHHGHHRERGISTKIALDADKSPQYVSDWKNGRAQIPMSTLAKLAALYGVSTGYLAGFTDNPAQTAPQGKAMMRAKMVELVEDVVSQLNPNADPKIVLEMCDLALEMLEDDKDEDTILGALYRKMRERTAQ